MAAEPFENIIILFLSMHEADYRLQKGALFSAQGNRGLMYSLIYWGRASEYHMQIIMECNSLLVFLLNYPLQKILKQQLNKS